MLDIKFIRENKEIVAAGAKKKRIEIDLEKLLSLDDKRKELQGKADEKRAEQNAASQKIAGAAPEEKDAIIAQMSEVKQTLKLAEESLAEVIKEWRLLMVQVPNVPDMSVPEGDSDADNQEVRVAGEIPKFDFEPKSHVDLLLMHGMADYERGVKVAGFRGYFLKNDG
ncbi:MAG: serine--tRNA ligase, partial [Patescibacteria group bacterium]